MTRDSNFIRFHFFLYLRRASSVVIELLPRPLLISPFFVLARLSAHVFIRRRRNEKASFVLSRKRIFFSRISSRPSPSLPPSLSLSPPRERLVGLRLRSWRYAAGGFPLVRRARARIHAPSNEDNDLWRARFGIVSRVYTPSISLSLSQYSHCHRGVPLDRELI